MHCKVAELWGLVPSCSIGGHLGGAAIIEYELTYLGEFLVDRSAFLVCADSLEREIFIREVMYNCI